MKNNGMNLLKVSNDDIQALAEEVFDKKISQSVDLGSVDITCEREVGTEVVKVIVNVFGMAGSVNFNDFKKDEGEFDKLKDARTFVIERSDLGSATFTLNTSKMYNLNNTDYVLIYESK